MRTSTKNIIIVASFILVVSTAAVIFYPKFKKNTLPTNKKIKNLLFVGDSNTQANFSYADKIKKDFPDVNVKKISQNGQTTSWMLSQLENDLQKNKYDVIFLLAGSNDIYGGTAIGKTKDNISKINDLIKKNGAISFIISPPNKDFYVNKTDVNQKKLSDLIDWEKNQDFDYFINFKNLTNDKSLFSKDDGYLHPQSHAHSILENEILKKIHLS